MFRADATQKKLLKTKTIIFMIQEIHDTRNETLETRNFLKKLSESEIPTNGMDVFSGWTEISK